MSKNFAEHCERNKQPILDQLAIHFKSSRRVLEIGSGTGQHAVFFAENLPHLIWHTSDTHKNHDSINAWITESQLKNIAPPVTLKIGRDSWPDVNADAVFTANTTHIMQPEEVQQMMTLVALNLPEMVFSASMDRCWWMGITPVKAIGNLIRKSGLRDLAAFVQSKS